jgi:CDP-6-deoxy-D-xylo-4-hexulose-3-dehydrase
LVDSARIKILSDVRAYADEMLSSREVFKPGETAVPVSGKVLDPSDFEALVDASLDGWLTAGRFHKEFEEKLGIPPEERIQVVEEVSP